MGIVKYLLHVPAFLAAVVLGAQDPFPALPPVFRDDVLPRVDILIPPDSLNILLAPGNEESDYHWHATFIFDNGEMKDTVENVGFRLRGNTSRYSKKKSFKVSFNTYVPGRQWEGLDKLNLNGEHNDPSVVRSKICWDLLRWMKVPAPRANHVDLYINGQYRGLYINVEHIDDEFVQSRFGNSDGNLYKCLYPADLDYKGANPDLYKEEFGGRRAYELTTNEDVDDYSDLAHFIDVLNNTPLAQLPCELEQVFEVDNYLKAAAFDVLSGNWDGPIYNKNNFYLYHNQSSGKFEYIPYDLDNTLGIDWLGVDWVERDIYNWSPSDPRPIYDRLMAVPAYRDRYSYYLDQFMDELFEGGFLFPYIDNLKEMITLSAEEDPYRPLDWGFSVLDFHDSYDFDLPWFHTPVGLKPYVTGRRNSALEQLDLNNIPPVISWVANNHPNSIQDISVGANVEDDGAISSLEVCYLVNEQNLICLPMFDDGQHADGDAGDGRYGAIIPALNQPAQIDYYIRATDDTGLESRNPVCDFRTIYIGSSTVPVVINEFMASNSSTYADPAGEYDDWIELFNLSDVPVYMGNYFMSDKEDNPSKWPLPDIWIQPGGYLVFWADEDQEQGIFHTNFKLSAEGEYIGIFDNEAANFALIDGVTFGQQTLDDAYGRLPNGTGPFQEVYATPGAENQPPNSTIEAGEHENLLEIFPNPFSGNLIATWKDPAGQRAKLVLRNALGVSLLEREISGGESLSLDTGVFPAGMYLIEIIGPKGLHLTKKAILQR